MRLLSWITLPPLTLATLYLAVANRHRVLFSLDPFSPDNPALALEVPLFAVVLFAVLLGILIGGAAAWTRQGRWRKEARQKRRDVKRLEDEVSETTRNLPVSTASRSPETE
ncbi:MAG: LapA family protein [Parvibaculaceae bacterium]|jgi:uncharacterized integral membrane protein